MAGTAPYTTRTPAGIHHRTVSPARHADLNKHTARHLSLGCPCIPIIIRFVSTLEWSGDDAPKLALALTSLMEPGQPVLVVRFTGAARSSPSLRKGAWQAAVVVRSPACALPCLPGRAYERVSNARAVPQLFDRSICTSESGSEAPRPITHDRPFVQQREQQYSSPGVCVRVLGLGSGVGTDDRSGCS
jgi:hypothetical protein